MIRRDTVVLTLDRQVGAVGLRNAGGLILAVREGFATWEPGQPDVTVVAAPLGSSSLCRMNDGACDAAGRFWAGSMALQDGVLGEGSLYRLEPDGSAVEVLAGISLSNGIDWSPDGRTMYHVDTSARTLSAYPFNGLTGALGPSQVLIDFESGDGYPDGITVDAAGCIWVSLWLGSRVCRYSPDGELLGVVEVPTPLVTSCAFGGPTLEDLYITTASRDLDPTPVGAGDLYLARTGVAGTQSHRFGG